MLMRRSVSQVQTDMLVETHDIVDSVYEHKYAVGQLRNEYQYIGICWGCYTHTRVVRGPYKLYIL